MTFGVIFVDRLVVVVRHTVSRKTGKYPNPSNERSEKTSSHTTQTVERVKLVRVLVSDYAVREDGKASNELVQKEQFCVPDSSPHVRLCRALLDSGFYRCRFRIKKQKILDFIFWFAPNFHISFSGNDFNGGFRH